MLTVKRQFAFCTAWYHQLTQTKVLCFIAAMTVELNMIRLTILSRLFSLSQLLILGLGGILLEVLFVGILFQLWSQKVYFLTLLFPQLQFAPQEEVEETKYLPSLT